MGIPSQSGVVYRHKILQAVLSKIFQGDVTFLYNQGGVFSAILGCLHLVKLRWSTQLELSMELITKFNLIEWATVLAFITALWKFVLKSAFEIWWKNKLEEQKQEVGNALSIQRDLTLKKIEFEQIKLERVLPLLEEINSAILGF